MPQWILGSAPKPLSAFSGVETLSAVHRARLSMFLDSAENLYLNRLGGNAGIPRHPLAANNDDLYRNLIAVLAWQPKTVLQTFYAVASAVFGTQALLVSAQRRPWRVFEVNPNEIIFELPLSFTASSNETSTYLHGFAGAVLPASDVTHIVTAGDATKVAASLVTLNAYVLDTGSLPYVAHGILSASYDSPSDTTTITLSSALSSSSAIGTTFFIDVPGDEVSSYRGDYFALNALQVADTPTTPTHDDRVYLTGEGLLDLFLYYINLFVRASGVVLRVARVGS